MLLRGLSSSLENVLWPAEITECILKARLLEDLLSVRNIMKEPTVIQLST